MFKKILLGINILLLLAVGYLLYFHFSNYSSFKPTKKQITNNGQVVYIDIDKLLKEYQYAIDLTEELTTRQEDIRTDLNIEGKKLEKMVKSFQRKLENNGFTSRARAEREQKRILKKEKEFQELKDKLTQELFNKQEEMQKNLGDTINSFLKSYNTSKDYDLILRTTKNGTVLYGKNTLDITEEIIDYLNKRYKK